MGRPRKDPDRVATPDRILQSALSVFAREGYAKARLADIARGAAVTRPSLLYHFGSKQALYEAVVKRTFDRIGVTLGGAMAEPRAFDERLRGVAVSFAGDLAEHPEDARIIVGELTSDEGPGRSILLERVTPLLATVIAFVRSEGGGRLRADLDVRAAVLQVAADVLLQNATSPEVRRALWGERSSAHTALLVTSLFLVEEA